MTGTENIPSIPPGATPLVVTLGLDAAFQQRLERDRRRFFPEHLNQVPAHVSLFHHLPGEAWDTVETVLAGVCAVTPKFGVTATGVMSLGRGTAWRLSADGALHARLAASWHAMLTAQDRQAWRPHVTIQNKVTPLAAKDLQSRLSATFAPFGGMAESVLVWRYLRGPWEALAEFPLTG